MAEDRVTWDVLVKGRVTGVGFRFAAVREAGRYPDLGGFVRNRSHDTVEALLQGPREQVQGFLGWLKKGPPAADVRAVDVKELDTGRTYLEFDISY